MRQQGLDPIIVDAGNLLFSSNRRNDETPQKRNSKAELIWTAYTNSGLQAFAPGPNDFLGGLALLEGFRDQGKVPFLAANLKYPDGRPFAKDDTLIIKHRGVKIGFFGLQSKRIFSARKELDIGLKVEDPFESGARVIDELEGKADVIVLLSQLGKSELEKFCSDNPELDFVIAGNHVVGFNNRARKFGEAYAMQGSSRGRALSRLDITVVDDKFDFMDAREYESAKRSYERYDSELTRLMGQTDGRDPEEYWADNERKLARYRRIVENRDKYRQQMESLSPDQSRFEITDIKLSSSIPDDPAIANLVDSFEAGWAAKDASCNK